MLFKFFAFFSILLFGVFPNVHGEDVSPLLELCYTEADTESCWFNSVDDGSTEPLDRFKSSIPRLIGLTSAAAAGYLPDYHHFYPRRSTFLTFPTGDWKINDFYEFSIYFVAEYEIENEEDNSKFSLKSIEIQGRMPESVMASNPTRFPVLLYDGGEQNIVIRADYRKIKTHKDSPEIDPRTDFIMRLNKLTFVSISTEEPPKNVKDLQPFALLLSDVFKAIEAGNSEINSINSSEKVISREFLSETIDEEDIDKIWQNMSGK